MEVLQQARNSDFRPKLVGQQLRVVTSVNLRSRCPVLIDGAAYYGKIVTALNPGDRIVPKSVSALEYLDDVFYWATIERIMKAN
jgi:hypothetical protein